MPRITKSAVDTAKAGSKDAYLWDSELSGFGVKITPGGRKVYLVQFRVGGKAGRTRRITLGADGIITAEQARSEAKAVLRSVARGEDPAAARDQRRTDRRFGQVLENFLAEHADAKLKQRSSIEYRRLMHRKISASLLNRPLSEVTRGDLSRLHLSMRDTPYQANRIIAVLSKFFSWCEKNEFVPDGSNPARHVEKFREDKRRRFLSPKEIAALGEGLLQAEAANIAGPYVIAAIRLLALTGARLNEILTLKWEHINFDNRRLQLPDSKTGAKNVFLNPPALSVLADLPRFNGNPFVICGERAGAHLVNLQKPWRRIRALAGLDDVRLHDLRHSFASVAVASGMSLPLIGALLGHSQPQTTARYAHLADDPLKAAADLVGQKMEAVAGIRVTK